MHARDDVFIQTIKEHYRQYGRHTLPWRSTHNPYRIIVSELMLQQTQVERVIPKYRAFLKRFPTLRSLAQAPLREVLEVWSGLGYNRRAKYLHQMAQAIVREYKGKFPDTYETLTALPGIGPYTAGAILAFAYNQPLPIIETNIRTVYLHHFFKNKSDVSDAALRTIIIRTLDIKNPRAWYWALMDYGSYLKQSGSTVHRASSHYAKQSTFIGSRRQIRGAIMRELLKGSMMLATLVRITQKEKEVIRSVLDDLIVEGMISKKGRTYMLF